ncbi:hypothetical protein EFB08_14210 [Rufibacter latericius]|uniref:Uncharacterized protein n=1 Tax=Rufibacter latericius TaxID=2487040 RepID=A0A3M9MK86_9BACT|nr:hypothetical protein EFB08_14210 [Rufibacter latericius]
MFIASGGFTKMCYGKRSVAGCYLNTLNVGLGLWLLGWKAGLLKKLGVYKRLAEGVLQMF